jgi:hypothetical protein
MSKSSIEELYVIVDKRNLEYVTNEGYTSCYMQNALKCKYYDEAKKELAELDEPNNFQIYKVTQVIESSFEAIEEVSEQ